MARFHPLDGRVRKYKEPPMAVSRRNAMAMLGLAPAGAIGTEAFAHPDDRGPIRTGVTSNDQIARALRLMADKVEARQVLIERVDFRSNMQADEIMRHEMQIRFIYDYPADAV